MNVPPLTADEQTFNPMHQDQEMAAFLDSMLLSEPMEVSGNDQASKEDSPKKPENEVPTGVAESHEAVLGSEPDLSEYDEFCLILGLVSSEKDFSPHYDQETVLLDVFEQIYNDEAVYKVLRVLLAIAATIGNLTESQARQVHPPMMERIKRLMNSVGVKFGEISTTRDTNEESKETTVLQKFLPPEAKSRIPSEPTFLHAGPLECVLSKESDKKKLQDVMQYLSDQLCEQLATETGHDEEKIRLSISRSQAISSPKMEFLIKYTMNECDLVDALSRVELPTNSAVSSKKCDSDKKPVKGKPSKT